MKNLPWILFGLLVAMCLLVGTALITGEAPSSDPPPPMERGDPEGQKEPLRVFLGWTLGTLEIAFFVCCLALGIGERRNRRWEFVTGGLLFCAAFAALVFTNSAYLDSHQPRFFLSFPLPTAVMLYALWPAPVFFVIWYTRSFDRLVLTPRDLDRFEKIIKKNQSSSETGD